MKKRIVSVTLAAILILALIPSISSAIQLPSLELLKETSHFEIFGTDQERSALDDLADALEESYSRITSDLGITMTTKTRVDIYPDLESYHWGIGQPGSSNWSVGSGWKNRLVMVSPLNPGPSHNYDSIMLVAVHEFVHVVTYELFPSEQYVWNRPKYLSEGLAAYEAGQSNGALRTIPQDADNGNLPSLDDLEHISGDGDYKGYNVYTYGYAYIDFIAQNFGLSKAVSLLKGDQRDSVLGVSDEMLESMWYEFLTTAYLPAAEPDEPVIEDTPFIQVEGSSAFDLYVTDVNDKEVVSSFARMLDERRNRVLSAFGNNDVTVDKSIIRLYNNLPLPESDDSYYKEIREFDGTQIQRYGVLFHNGDLWITLPSEFRDRIIRKAADSYAELLIKKCGISKGSSTQYWYAWVFDGLVRYVDGVQTDSQIIEADIAKGNVPRPFSIVQIKDEERREAYAEVGVNFIVDVYGFDKLSALLSCNGKYEEVLGANHEDIAKDWIDYVESTFGQGAVAVDLVFDDEFLMGVAPRTKLSCLFAALRKEGYASVTAKLPAGESVQNQGTVATGLHVSADKNGDTEEWVLVVQGDVLGNGTPGITQVVRLVKAFTGSDPLDGPYLLAADTNGSGKIDLSDVIQMVEALTQ